MAKRCELTGVGVQTGHKVSHSNRKTRRRFLPNLQSVSLLSSILGRAVNMRITVSALRSVDHNGGIDGYLLSHSNSNLPEKAKKLKKKIEKALEAKEAVTAEKPKKAEKKAVKKTAPARKAKAKTTKAKSAKAKE